MHGEEGTLDGGYHDDDGGYADDGDANLDTSEGERGFGPAPSAAASSGVDGDGGDGDISWVASSAQCPACGATSAALDVHVICGTVHGERPCGCAGGWCAGIPAVRSEFRRRYTELFKLAGGAECLESTPAGTHEYLALILGGARGTPPALSAELAVAFDETWGDWSHEQRLRGAK